LPFCRLDAEDLGVLEVRLALLFPLALLLAFEALFEPLDLVALPRLLEEPVEGLLEAFEGLPLERFLVELLRLRLDELEEREPLVFVCAIAGLLTLGRGPECLRHLVCATTPVVRPQPVAATRLRQQQQFRPMGPARHRTVVRTARGPIGQRHQLARKRSRGQRVTARAPPSRPACRSRIAPLASIDAPRFASRSAQPRRSRLRLADHRSAELDLRLRRFPKSQPLGLHAGADLDVWVLCDRDRPYAPRLRPPAPASHLGS
jgi:hypothetical protein